MTPKSPQMLRQPDSDWQGFLKLARHVSETIGTEFLSTLVDQLAAVLEAKCMYVSEFVGGKTNRIRTLAAFVEGGRPEAFTEGGRNSASGPLQPCCRSHCTTATAGVMISCSDPSIPNPRNLSTSAARSRDVVLVTNR